MAELKTKENNASVTKFINAIDHPQRKADAKVLLKIFREQTKEKPKMWGTSIVGFGNVHYTYASGREGDWMAVGFSPRKQSLSLYIMADFDGKDALYKKLGKHKTGRGCLYINKLDDVDLSVLKKIIRKAYVYTKKTGSFC